MKRIVGLSAVGLIALIFGLGYIGLEYDRIFRPALEEVRRETFEQSQSRVQGQASYLNRLRMDMARAESDEHRCAIRATALHEAAQSTTLTDDLSEWVETIRGMEC